METQESQFPDSESGWASRWQMELKMAREALKDFYTVAAEVETALRDEKTDDGEKRLCLYPSNVQTIGAMLYGRTPQASVGRKFADADDDEARVASEMLERVLNCDIEKAGDTFQDATKNAMMDWRGPGLGVERHRYELGPMKKIPGVEAKLDPVTGAELAPAIKETEEKTWERIDTDYVHFRDFLYGQCRVWADVPWVAFLAKMPREDLVKRFGDDIGNLVPLNAKRRDEDGKADQRAHPWDRADVWEIWDKKTKKVFWVVEGFDKTLDVKEDPLELEGFWPCQRPMMANLTTSKLIPVSDYKFAQDLYKSVDTLTTRIGILTEAVRVAGVYDSTAGDDVAKLVKGGENKLYPVSNWAMFAEKGGLKGVVDYLPLDQIVATLGVLRDTRREDIDLIYQVTGQSDVMRGQQTANGTPGEAQVKAKFGSVRLQAMQDEIARFASDGQRIRAEIIAKHFSPKTIIENSNVMRTPDAPMAQAAAALIQSRFSDYRIEIKPEAINLTDFAALKEERFEVLAGIASYFSAIGPAVQQFGPDSLPFFLQMLQITVAGLKGGSAYEAVIDQAIAKAKQAAQSPKPQAQPDPKILVAQMKGQQDLQKIQAETQARMAEIGAEVQADAQREQTQALWNTREHSAKLQATNALKPVLPGSMGGGI